MFKNIIAAVSIFYIVSGCSERTSKNPSTNRDSVKTQDSMLAATSVDMSTQPKTNDTLSENKLFSGSDTLIEGNYHDNGHTTN